MKKATISLLISILIGTGCYAQKNTCEQADTSVLIFYCQYSSFTDPGEYAFMYAGLPARVRYGHAAYIIPDEDLETEFTKSFGQVSTKSHNVSSRN